MSCVLCGIEGVDLFRSASESKQALPRRLEIVGLAGGAGHGVGWGTRLAPSSSCSMNVTSREMARVGVG